MKFCSQLLIMVFLSYIGLFAGEEHTQNVNIPVVNAGFEQIDENGNLNEWLAADHSSFSTDKEIKFAGRQSVHLQHSDWQQSTLLSAPLELKVGHLYKLTAMAKSRQAETNPMDRYPTSVAGCIGMASFPFTNHSPAIAGSGDWQTLTVYFIATQSSDRIQLSFGMNGKARGEVWFDNVQLEKVEDIREYIAPESVRWFGNAYRYDDRGWIFLHIEGEPYARGYQYGNLISEEMTEYMKKISIELNKKDPESAWHQLRFVADAFMLRKFDKEYLTEMRGIADGANKAGVRLFGRKLDLVDVVTMNSAIDIEYAGYAMQHTANPLSGQSFLEREDELNIPQRLHKCSGFLANHSATTDGRIVFGQIFMWGGYTGPHWNVICDVQPAQGHRLVYQTFPGGIHSGADFYINDSGIMIGETTVNQTPFNPDGSPQSNRIRKAAQYANSIDDVVKILTTNNNGMYANDWLIGDSKSDEIAVLLLGTNKYKLWRSSKKEFYGNTTDFYWCNNNAKDNEVRREYVPNPDNAPHDLIFSPWNRDIAFNEFYQQNKGKIDANAGVRAWNSAPLNRPHACDGKITTSEMAENLVFMANSGKVTLREKFVGENKRIPNLPGAQPRLSLGYSIVSPKFITDKLQEWKKAQPTDEKEVKTAALANPLKAYEFNERQLWFNTVYPASAAENWFVSASAAYWKMLKRAPKESDEISDYFSRQLAALNSRYLYTTRREGTLAPQKATRIYDRYNNYQVPRIKGTYLLHQMRLYLGNEIFSKIMNRVHEKFREKEMHTSDFIKIAEKISSKKLTIFVNQWLQREDLPRPDISSDFQEKNGKYIVELQVAQPDFSWHFVSSIKIETADSIFLKKVEVKQSQQNFQFRFNSRPTRLTFNALNDIPLEEENYFTWSNFFDDFHHCTIVYGTSRQIEANHTLALRFSKVLADRYTEMLMPVQKDCEISAADLTGRDLIVLGSPSENSLMKAIVDSLHLSIEKNVFHWQGKTYGRADQGMFAAYPNPFNPQKTVYLFFANSALQLYQMTKDRVRMPAWAIYQADKIEQKGFHTNTRFIIEFK